MTVLLLLLLLLELKLYYLLKWAVDLVNIPFAVLRGIVFATGVFEDAIPYMNVTEL